MTTGIQNPPPRFGLEGNQLYDYVSKAYVPIGPRIVTAEGSWNTERVAALIREGKQIEGALIVDAYGEQVFNENVALKDEVDQLRAQLAAVQPDPASTQQTGDQPPAVDPVDQANKDFNDAVGGHVPTLTDIANGDFVKTIDGIIGVDGNGSPVVELTRGDISGAMQPQEAV